MTGRQGREAASAAFPLRTVITLGTILATMLGGFYALREQVARIETQVEIVGPQRAAAIAAAVQQVSREQQREVTRLELMIVENRARAMALAETQSAQSDRVEADIAEIKAALQQLLDRERENLRGN